MGPEGNDKDDLLVAALACGSSFLQAGKRVGYSEHTVWRRMQLPEFRARVSQARAELIALATGRFARAMSRASAVLVRLLKSKNEKVRLAAAREVVTLGIKLREAGELADKVAELEALLEGLRNGRVDCSGNSTAVSGSDDPPPAAQSADRAAEAGPDGDPDRGGSDA
jgi:hypothetical protein